MIKDLKQDQLRIPLVEAIAKALFIKQNNDVGPDAQKEMADYVSKVLKESFTTYRIKEVCQAIELWAIGELFRDGDMNVPSPENIFKAIHRYGDLIRRTAIDKQQQYEEKLNKDLSEKEKQEKVKAFEYEICSVYDSYCDTFGELQELSMGLKASYCRHLYEKNIVELTVEQEQEIFSKAKKLLPTEEQIRGMNAVDRAFHNKKKEAQLQEIAESIALEYLFTEYFKKEVNLREKINHSN